MNSCRNVCHRCSETVIYREKNEEIKNTKEELWNVNDKLTRLYYSQYLCQNCNQEMKEVKTEFSFAKMFSSQSYHQ